MIRNRLDDRFASAWFGTKRWGWRGLRRVAFGDRIGEILFVGALVVYAALWHIGFIINDNWTIANTLVGVANGHLYIDRVVYGTYVSTPGTAPGTHIVDQRLYGRNYGHVFLALPFLWALQALAAVIDPRVLIAAGWSLLIVLLAHRLGGLAGSGQRITIGGCGVALLAFGVNVGLATPLDPFWFPVMALQLGTMFAGAVLIGTIYRLVRAITDRRTGALIGGIALVSTPIGLWASIPKRHTVTAALVTLVVFSFAKSRTADTPRRFRHRALAYGWVGLLAWVFAAEALVVVLALGVTDLLTVRDRGLRRIVTLGIVFTVSLVPFFVTNALVTGNPLLPPMLWPTFDGTQPFRLGGELVAPDGTPLNESVETPDGLSPNESVESAVGPGESAAGGADDERTLPRLVAPVTVITTVTSVLERLLGLIRRSIGLVITDPDRVYHTFLRSGWFPEQARDTQSINLAIVESAPVVGAAVSLPLFFRRLQISPPWRWRPRRQTDLLVGSIAAGYLLIYLPSLPLHAQLTVRYLHPLFPLLMYAIARLPPVRTLLRERLRLVLWSYAAGVLIGGQLVVAILAVTVSSVGGALQFQALVSLASAGLLVTWVVLSQFFVDPRSSERFGAVLLGGAVAAGTVLLVFMCLNHFAYGSPAMALGRLARVVIPP